MDSAGRAASDCALRHRRLCAFRSTRTDRYAGDSLVFGSNTDRISHPCMVGSVTKRLLSSTASKAHGSSSWHGRACEFAHRLHLLEDSATALLLVSCTHRCSGQGCAATFLLRFHGRLVRKTLSYSKNASYLQRHLDLEDPVFNFVRAHQALRVTLPRPIPHRKWQQRPPAMAAGLTDHIWTLEEYCPIVFHHLEGKGLFPQGTAPSLIHPLYRGESKPL
jgi:hypothetical protein